MTKKFILMVLPLAVLAVSACAKTEVETREPGRYTSTTKSTNSDGTNYKTTKTTDVKVDANGNKYGSVQTETETDPKGLFNSSTSKTRTTVK